MTRTASMSPVLRRGLLLAFTAPTFVLGIMHGPEGQVQAIYAKHAGVALTSLALALLLGRIFDAVTYPLIGWLSDQTYARSGSRKGWVIGGSAVSLLGMWQLMRPPAEVGAVYFGIWMAVLYLGWKLMEIPLQAWSYGLSQDYAQRMRVQAWRGLSQLTGSLLFFVVPFLAVQVGVSDSTELDFRTLSLTAILCVVALPLATLVAVAGVPDGSAPPPERPRRPGVADMIAAVRANPPLLRLVAAFVPVNLLTGLMNGVLYLYVDAYLGLNREFPAVMVLALLASIAGIPFWSALGARFERHRVWAVALIVGGVSCGGLALVTPGPLALPVCFVLLPLAVFAIASSVIVFAMSADIVDYGRLNTGEDHAGLYGSIFAFAQKSLLGVSVAAGLAIAGAFGFDATASEQTAAGVFGLKLAVAMLPAIGLIAAAAVIWSYPLTRARVAEIQAQLHRRDAAPAAAAPPST